MSMLVQAYMEKHGDVNGDRQTTLIIKNNKEQIKIKILCSFVCGLKSTFVVYRNAL